MEKVTALITTYNEARNIPSLVENLSFSDEILIVDSYSTDDTVKLATDLGCRVIQHKYEDPASQKNWGIPQATYSYVILLDADERIPKALEEELKAELENPKADAYWVYRDNFFMGRKLAHSGIQKDKVVRLIKRDACRYNQKKVHEEIEITDDTKVSYFKNRLEHYTYSSLNDTLHKMNRYGDYQVVDYLKKTGHVTIYHLFFKPAFRFCKHFIFGRGFLDGFPGFMFAYTQAYSVRIRYLKIKMVQKGYREQ